MHELATNAAKYGALSTPHGWVQVAWEFEQGNDAFLRFSWKECDGPRVIQPERSGFGHIVLTEAVPLSLRGRATLEFQLEGATWILVVPTEQLLAQNEKAADYRHPGS